MARPAASPNPGIFLLTNVPAVYRLELYAALAADPRCRFEAAFTALDHPSTAHCQARREDLQFPWQALVSCGWPFGRHPGGPVRGLATHLARFMPTAVIVAGASPAACQALLLARHHGSRRILWWGGTRPSEAGTSRLKSLWRRGVFSLADGFIAYSEHAAEYLMACGVPARRILVLGNLTFDVHARMARMDAIPREPATTPRMVAVCQLSPRKNVRFLLDVHAAVRKQLPGLELEVIGDGPERAALERHCLDHTIGGVRFLGRLENSHTLQRLRQADVLVHPAALDQWPQVINEGMTAGLPIVASTNSGLSANLVRDGVNGWLLELDPALWVEHLANLLSNPALVARMGHSSREILEDYDLGRITARLLEFVLEGVS